MPDIKGVQYSRFLTDFSLGFQGQEFMGTRLFPVKRAGARLGQFYKYGVEAFQAEDDLRAPGTEANEVDHGYSQDAFRAEEHSLKEGVPWEVRDEAMAAGGMLDPYQDATRIVTEKIALGREIDIATTVRSVANITQNTTLTGTAQWTDYTNSDPIGIAEQARAAIRGSLYTDGSLIAIVPFAVYRKLKYHTKILNSLTITQTKILTKDLLAALWEVDEVLIPAGLYNTANFGQAPVMTDIWGKDVIFAHVDPNPGLQTQTLGITFRVQYPNGRPAQVRYWNEDVRKRDVVEVNYTEARKITNAGAAYLVKAAIP